MKDEKSGNKNTINISGEQTQVYKINGNFFSEMSEEVNIMKIKNAGARKNYKGVSYGMH